LAKLHHGVVQLLDEADGILNTATRECRDISSRFVVRMYIVQFSWLYLVLVWQKIGYVIFVSQLKKFLISLIFQMIFHTWLKQINK
jgi:hypothetical protein